MLGRIKQIENRDDTPKYYVCEWSANAFGAFSRSPDQFQTKTAVFVIHIISCVIPHVTSVQNTILL